MAREEKAIIEEIAHVECALSPENLQQDGERPASVWKPIQKRLLARKASLIKELGRTPTEQELWS